MKMPILFKGKYTRLKMIAKSFLMIFGIRVIRRADSNGFKRLYFLKPSIQYLKDNNDGNLTVCEVGVWKGENAARMLKILPIDKFYGIDPWVTYNSSGHNQDEMSDAEKEARKRLRKFTDNGRCILIKAFANDALKEIPDSSCDFIYIDGDHEYKFVRQDIENYWAKVKPGGIMAGDDINCFYDQRCGVARALMEWAVANNLTDRIVIESPDWWLHKPKESREERQKKQVSIPMEIDPELQQPAEPKKKRGRKPGTKFPGGYNYKKKAKEDADGQEPVQSV